MLVERLIQLRAENNFTQDDMAERLGVKRQTYGAYERNVSSPDIQTLVKLADMFSVSTDYLLGRTNHRIEKVDSVNKTICDIIETAEKVSPNCKSDLFRMLNVISEMLNLDKIRDDDRSLFSIYAVIMESLRNFDENVEGYATNFLLNRENEKNDPKGINVTKNIMNYYSMIDKMRESALGTGEMISHMLRCDAVLCVSGQRETLREWSREAFAEDVGDSVGEYN